MRWQKRMEETRGKRGRNAKLTEMVSIVLFDLGHRPESTFGRVTWDSGPEVKCPKPLHDAMVLMMCPRKTCHKMLEGRHKTRTLGTSQV